MTRWTMQPQEQEGNYYFQGNRYTTALVFAELSLLEISNIYSQVTDYVRTHNGADYLFVFTDKKDRKLFLIDNLSHSQLQRGNYDQEHNYSTLMFAHEY